MGTRLPGPFRPLKKNNNLFSFFSDSNEERESQPPDKEEVPEKTGKTEPTFTKESSRFFPDITRLPLASKSVEGGQCGGASTLLCSKTWLLDQGRGLKCWGSNHDVLDKHSR